MTTPAELRSLLADSLAVWEVEGRVSAEAEGLVIATANARCIVVPGPTPTRWFLTAGTRTRPVPSVPALLSAIRRAIGVPSGGIARIGTGSGIL